MCNGSLPSQRPASQLAPAAPAFDVGWNAHHIGFERDTVKFLAPPSGRNWALMGWDVRDKLCKMKLHQEPS